jgi:hypothetical protein
MRPGHNSSITIMEEMMRNAMDSMEGIGSIEPSQQVSRYLTWTGERKLWAAVIALAREDAAMQHGWTKGQNGCVRCNAWAWFESDEFEVMAELMPLDPSAVRRALATALGSVGVHPPMAGESTRSERGGKLLPLSHGRRPSPQPGL